jgi:uncharacterized protein YrrD
MATKGANGIVGLKVISVEEGRDLGSVSQVVVDLSVGALIGVIVGQGAAAKGIWADDITVFGVDALMIANRTVAAPLSEMPQLAEKLRESNEGPVEVVTDTGKRLGVLGNVYLDDQTHQVAHYEVSGGAWRDVTEGMLELPVIPGTKHGRDTVIVPAEELKTLAGGTGGLKAQLAQLNLRMRSTSHQVSERSHDVTTTVGGRLHTALEEGGEALRSRFAQVRERVTDIAQKAKESLASETPEGTEQAAKPAKPAKPANPAPIEWPPAH